MLHNYPYQAKVLWERSLSHYLNRKVLLYWIKIVSRTDLTFGCILNRLATKQYASSSGILELSSRDSVDNLSYDNMSAKLISYNSLIHGLNILFCDSLTNSVVLYVDCRVPLNWALMVVTLDEHIISKTHTALTPNVCALSVTSTSSFPSLFVNHVHSRECMYDDHIIILLQMPHTCTLFTFSLKVGMFPIDNINNMNMLIIVVTYTVILVGHSIHDAP